MSKYILIRKGWHESPPDPLQVVARHLAMLKAIRTTPDGNHELDHQLLGPITTITARLRQAGQ